MGKSKKMGGGGLGLGVSDRSHKEEYFVIKFDNGTYFDGSRYSNNEMRGAKKYLTEGEAMDAMDIVVNIFEAVEKDSLKIAKIIIQEE